MGAGDFAGTAAPAAPAQARRQPGNGKQQDGGTGRKGLSRIAWETGLKHYQHSKQLLQGACFRTQNQNLHLIQKSYRNVVMIGSSSVATICYESMAKEKPAPANNLHCGLNTCLPTKFP